MNHVFLVKYGELAIKGKNRYIFENRLVATIRRNIKPLGAFHVYKEQGRITIESEQDILQPEVIIDRLTRIFGIVGVAHAIKSTDISFEGIKSLAKMQMESELNEHKHLSFKVETKRADKRFPMSSMEISRELGAYLLDTFEGQLTVDVHQPMCLLQVEIRNGIYVYTKTYKGAGGMPYGTNGKACLLLSGGIDSPVAGWMIAKRGVEIDAIYFHSPPYTSERAKEKVVDLAKKVSVYTGGMTLYNVPFTDIQMAIYEKCPHDQLTIIMRRIMMEIAQRIAESNGSHALITGESIGQVASQTMQSLVVTDASARMPVFRPLIGFDKEEIVRISKRIDTYETSILPYEDCCTIFVPKHPQTKPKLEYIEKSEKALESILEDMITQAIGNTEIIKI